MEHSTQLNESAQWNARYHDGSTPWDRGIVAPEVVAFANEYPGADQWALDIGCGTGTHSRELARHGYRVAGIDLSQIALQRALTTAQTEGLPWVGVQGSAANLDFLDAPFAAALDIGCFHGMAAAEKADYAAALNRRLIPGGHYLLYAVHPRIGDESGPPGVNPARILELFAPNFTLEWRNEGRQGQRQADWWLWHKPRLEPSP